MPRSRPTGLLVDTNFVSAWREARIEPPSCETTVYVSTATLQELYNMQSGEGWGYRYLIPPFVYYGPGFTVRYREYIRTRRARRENIGVLRGDSSVGFALRLPDDASFHDEEYVMECCHAQLVRLHKSGNSEPIEELARQALGRNISKCVKANFEFITEQRMEPILVDERIADLAVSLLRSMRNLAINYKARPRNTFNDLLILATALDYGLDLRTNDKVLKRISAENGLSVLHPREEFSLVTSPTPSRPPKNSRELNGYVNGQWRSLPPRLY